MTIASVGLSSGSAVAGSDICIPRSPTCPSRAASVTSSSLPGGRDRTMSFQSPVGSRCRCGHLRTSRTSSSCFDAITSARPVFGHEESASTTQTRARQSEGSAVLCGLAAAAMNSCNTSSPGSKTVTVPNVQRATMFPHITERVLPASTVYTDELAVYKHAWRRRVPASRESLGEAARKRGRAHDTIEGFWSLTTRGIDLQIVTAVLERDRRRKCSRNRYCRPSSRPSPATAAACGRAAGRSIQPPPGSETRA